MRENGIKHAVWEMTRRRVGREFFAAHTVTELAGWSDYALESEGRPTEPMVYDAATDHYVPIGWDAAFELVGGTLRGLDTPHAAAFYTSGRLNPADLAARGIGDRDLVSVTSLAKDGSRRAVQGYTAVAYDIPEGCAAGYMPELNVMCPAADYSRQSDQPPMKHLNVEITRDA